MSYNGWTNYETWRVNLEVFDGYDEALTAEIAEDIAHDAYCDGIESENTLAYDLVVNFLAKVNYEEIASHYKDEADEDYA